LKYIQFQEDGNIALIVPSFLNTCELCVYLGLLKTRPMKTNPLFLFICAISTLFFTETFSQVSINNDGTNPDSSSMLDVKSTSRGMLIPRMSTTERDAISNPATGLLIFCSDNNHFYSNQGTPGAKNWVMLNSQWISSGTEIYYNDGNVGIGTADPSFLLHIVGGDVKIGNIAGDARKLYFGDGNNVYIGEEAVDNRLGIFGNALTMNIAGTTGSPGQILTSNGTLCSWVNPAVSGSGTTSYIPKWSGSTTLSNSLLYDNGSNICIGTTTPSGKLTVNSGGASTSVYGQYSANVLGYLGGSNYGAFGQFNSNLQGYLGSSNYGAYGQYISDRYGYLGGMNYGAYGQNGSVYGYLGGFWNGVYGQSSANINGYLGGTYGAYGQYNATISGILGGEFWGVYGSCGAIVGHLASANYGAYGAHNSTLFGYLGGSSYGAYGQNNASRFGYLGGSNYGAYGQNSSTLYGYLGGSTYGAFGQYNSTQFGYLGGLSYGVWGQYSSTRYGNLGSSSCGAHGQYNNDIYGELGTSSYGVQGNHTITGGAAGYFSHSGIPGSYVSQWAVDGYMSNSLANDGSSYAYNSTGNNSGCIRGFNYDGATYSFAVAGWNWNDDSRCAGVIGARNDAYYWGALGYEDSGNNNYGGYFTSSTTGSGKSTGSGSAEGIGVGAWGGLIGADIHGGVYGIYVEGNNFGIYSKGPVFSDQPAIQLQDVGESERAIIYSGSSTEVTVMTCGQGSLVNGQCSVIYDNNFKKVVSQQIPVIITVTPMGPSNGVYISSSSIDGFSVTENNAGNSNVTFSYIAVGRRAGYENPHLPAEVLASDFESNMTDGLHNDADNATDGKGLNYQDGMLRLGHPAAMMQHSK
jgi:hypothetical protein